MKEAASVHHDARRAPHDTYQADVDRVGRIRERARTSPSVAASEAWSFLATLASPREQRRLAAIFETCAKPAALRGGYEGMVLCLFGAMWLDLVDAAVRAGQLLGGIGWTGKSFDPEQGTGFNRLTRSSRLPMFFAMPRYAFDRMGDELIGFRFDTRVEPSPLTPTQDVLAVVYANPKYGNPLVLPDTRDELVELTPGVYLGRALWRGAGRWRVVGYFALRDRAGAKS